jgi:uncharacterized RDD family membrane protein YckC
MRISPVLRLRATAYLIDLCAIYLLAVATLAVSVLTYGLVRYAGDTRLIKAMLASPETGYFVQLAHAIFYFSYFTLCHWYFGRTIGKWATGLEVTHKQENSLSFSRSFLRSTGYLISGSFTFGIGFLIALFRKDGRALHDIIADTDVKRVTRQQTFGQKPSPGQQKAA